MTKANYYNHQRGVSLIEVVIFGSIMGVLSLTFSSMVSDNMKNLSELEDRMSVYKLEREIKSLLTDPQSCLRTLGGKNGIAPNGITDIRNPDGSIFISGNDPTNVFENLRVDRIRHVNKNVAGPNSRGEVTIETYLIREKHQKIRRHIFKQINVDVYVEVNGSRQISKCSSHQDLLDQRQIASTPNGKPCSWRSNTFPHGSQINGSRIYFDSCIPTYACLDGVIVPAPSDCRSGRD